MNTADQNIFIYKNNLIFDTLTFFYVFKFKYVSFDITSPLQWEGMEKAELSLNIPLFLLQLMASVVIGQIPTGTGGEESRIYLSEKIPFPYRRKLFIVLWF